MKDLPTPTQGDETAWVAEHLGHLTAEGPDGVAASPRFRGGQTAADAALAAYDPTGYAARRNEVWPPERRGASALSPYIRYGLIPLQRAWDHVADAPSRDKKKFRDELLWQEYARHLYARVGARTSAALRYEPARSPTAWEDPWPRDMACVDLTVSELEQDGWLVNQTRMWLSSQYVVRAGHEWTTGEDRFFTHLLDGSRAANRLGWQWTIGAGTGRPYGFSRRQVQRRAPGLCKTCKHEDDCPIAAWPDADRGPRVEPPATLKHDPDVEATAGPAAPDGQPRQLTLDAGRAPEEDDGPQPRAVWLTAESLGDADPALLAHPDLPVVFVFDERRLAGWRLSGKRLVFLAETLADLATRRELEVALGDPADLRDVACTFTPVPGWRALADTVHPSPVHPWPWLRRPVAGSLQSWSAWVRQR